MPAQSSWITWERDQADLEPDDSGQYAAGRVYCPAATGRQTCGSTPHRPDEEGASGSREGGLISSSRR
jgi:hypothetical protein